MSSLESWAYLSRVVEGPSHHIQALLRVGKSADEIAEGVRTRATWIGGLLSQTENRFTWDRAAEDLEFAADLGYTLLTPESPQWPAEAIQCSFGRQQTGAAGKTSHQPDGIAPHALWVAGNTNLAGLFAQSVGVVGTRHATKYGHMATKDLVAGLGGHNYTVVSGGALGIDTVAHTTAMDVNTPTVMVAACGPGEYYPRSNKALFERVVATGGALITEYPPAVTPDRHRFLTRNRLVAALTLGTVLVEAPFRSGALNTLKWVNAFNRTAMAVPGPVTDAQSLGANLAIQNNEAEMVLNAGQIHEQLSVVGEYSAEEQMEMQYPPSVTQQLSRNELRIYDALPPAGRTGREAEAVAADAGLSIALTVHILMDLSKRGLVERDKRVWSRVEQPE
ncbi:DNA-protecting protein DprA [Corynebacterium pilbarense]|uniref:DNA-protecting protein DprA n=1 Tax=Corynebacterium pilbarense TaxID=1288393 RepID=A0A9Q4IF48_9CORY|nr:DNA-processing protein DprA [Corynebacterium pilbarense]MCZ2219795.1 DNA-protecting protein DprA [Corynebacterium pilbarense]